MLSNFGPCLTLINDYPYILLQEYLHCFVTVLSIIFQACLNDLCGQHQSHGLLLWTLAQLLVVRYTSWRTFLKDETAQYTFGISASLRKPWYWRVSTTLVVRCVLGLGSRPFLLYAASSSVFLASYLPLSFLFLALSLSFAFQLLSSGSYIILCYRGLCIKFN